MLPTKELAQQVQAASGCGVRTGWGLSPELPLLQVSKVFNIYTDATPLRVALVTGQRALAKEQESLVQKT